MKTYAIGDLHGRFDLLEKAIKTIEADSPEGGRLIVLGDFVDRGLQSNQIITRFMAGPDKENWKWDIIQGNHEDMMIQACAMPHKLNWWLGNGGDGTLASYGYKAGDKIGYPMSIPDEHIYWLMGLPYFIEEDERIFVHAGVPHGKFVTETKKQTLQWMLHKGDIEGAEGDIFEDKPNISGKHIVHGHHQSADHPLLLKHRTNLDSFAWYTGKLAIGVFNEEQAAPIKTLFVEGPNIKDYWDAYFSR